MGMIKFTSALITRALFILVSLVGVWRVTMVKTDPMYWYLTFLLLPLVLEMIITLKRRRGEDYKWFSPPIFLFLISIIPSLWLLELDHRQIKEFKLNGTQSGKTQCRKLDMEGMRTMAQNVTITDHESFQKLLASLCPNEWNLAFHHISLILLIVGRWLLPLGGGVTRDELSQLLLIFIGTAADILEFTSDTLSDVSVKTPHIVYLILSVWTWSMLQFPLHVSVVSSKKDDGVEQVDQEESLWSKHSKDLCSIMETLFIQDGPFLVTRLIVIVYCKVFHQMLGFFTIKNFLVISLNLYRLAVICQNFRQTSSGSSSSNEIAEP